MRYTDAWCACLVSVAALKADVVDIMPKEVSCEKMIELYKKAGRWQENDAYTPGPADVIFYDWDDSGTGDNKGASDHVGLVVSVSGGKIKVIEGNMSRAVGYRDIAVNGKYIRGYGLPDFARKVSGTGAEPTIDEIAWEVIRGIWGNGQDRVKRLTAAGYDAKAVQARVNQLLAPKLF